MGQNEGNIVPIGLIGTANVPIRDRGNKQNENSRNRINHSAVIDRSV